MKLLCFFGFHKWWPKTENYFNPYEAVFRTFMYCDRCKKYGKMVYFKKYKVN